MDRERMNRFVEKVREQKAREQCQKGHYYRSGKECENCGLPVEEAVSVEVI